MKTYSIVLLKGDGIGPEIVEQAVKVLKKAGEKYDFSIDFKEALLGGSAIDATGSPLPQETIDACKAADSTLLGAVGGPKCGMLCPVISGRKRAFWESGRLSALSANLRPAVIFPELKEASPLRADIIGDKLDIMVVRELTGGIYFGERGRKTVDGQEGCL